MLRTGACRTSVRFATVRVSPEIAAEDGSLAPPGDAAADVLEGPSMQHPILLIGHDGGATTAPYTGHDLLGEVYDLMRDRSGRLGVSDPYRPVVALFLSDLGHRLGRDRLVAVSGDPA